MLLRNGELLSCEDVDGRRGSDGGGGGRAPEEPYGCEADPRYGDGCDEEYRGCDEEGIGGGSRRDAETSSAIRNVLLLTSAFSVDVDEGALSMRDFFQICSVGEGRSSVSFRFLLG